MISSPQPGSDIALINRSLGNAFSLRKSSATAIVFGVILEFAALFIVLFVCIAGLFLGFDFLSIGGRQMLAYGIVMAFLMSVAGIISYPLARASAALLSSYDSLRHLDRPLPIVLFLRPFIADSDSVQSIFRNFWRVHREHRAALRPFSFARADPIGVTHGWNVEKVLVETFASCRVLAIGRPKELLQKAGAARLYATDDTWRSVVEHFMLHADMIFVHFSDPNDARGGLQWELDTLSRLKVLPKTTFLTVDKAGNGIDYDAAFTLFATLGITLPLTPIIRKGRGDILYAEALRFCYAVYFKDDSWQAVTVDTVGLPGLKAALMAIASARPHVSEHPKPVFQGGTKRALIELAIAAVLSIIICIRVFPIIPPGMFPKGDPRLQFPPSVERPF